jgi:hypothetical protein
VRLGEYEKAMLDRLVETWRQREGECSVSEAVRRCIVYTFSKLVAGVDSLDEDSLLRALSAALGGLARGPSRNH